MDGVASRAPGDDASDEALSVLAGDREVLLETGAPFVVGAGPDADLQVQGARVSPAHLVVAREDGAWLVRDVSITGTYAGGAPMTQARIAGPLILRLGDALAGPEVAFVPVVRAGALTQLGASLDEAPVPPPVGRPDPGDELGLLGRLSGVHAALRDHVRIGRAAENDIVVDDLSVSRHHAEMLLQPQGAFELVDLGSDNGTFVNGRRIERTVLEELDVVAIGRHLFRLVGPQLEEYVDEGRVSFEAEGLTVTAPSGRVLLDDMTLTLDESSLLAVVGPSGAGKSTLLNALTGFRPAPEGTVRYGGRDLYAEYDELRARIAFVPQDDVVHRALTVRQALGYAAEIAFPGDVSAEDRDRRVTEVIDELGLADAAGRVIARLSGGQRRRVCVGLALITRPTLLFLDEPTSGLDPGYERELMQLLRDLADGGRTIIVVTHSVQSLRLCDRVLFLAPGGRTAYFGPAQLALAYFGRDDFQEVFRDLSARREHDWSGSFAAHPYHRRYVAERRSASTVASAPPAPAGPAAEPRTVARFRGPRSWVAQFAILTRRYARVIASDRRYVVLLVLQPLVLGLLMLAALPAHELTRPPEGELRLVSRAGLVLLVLVLGATWLGASNSVREIVKELPILQRERAVGVSVSAYMASKVVVLGALTILQAAILVPLALARQGGPPEGSVLGWPLGELFLAAALAGLAGMALGLLISSIAGTADRAMTVLPVVLIVQMLLAMGGLFPDIVAKPVLKQASYVAGAQWGFSATASTVDLNRLQSVDRIASDLPVLRVDDPLGALRAVTARAGDGGERRWRHDWPTWTVNAGALLVLSLAAIAAATLALWRRRPGA